MTRRRHTRRFERGQSLIEFALVAPFVLVLLGALVAAGFALNSRSSLQQAVREGARRAAVGGTLADVQALAAGNAPELLAPGDVLWCHPVSGDGSQGKVGDEVRVYLYRDGDEGYPYALVPDGGIASVFHSVLTVRMSPRATATLEHSVASPVACPS